MTDPLSLIASVVTLLGTGRQVVKGFEKVLKLKKAPDVILALQNEISDVCCVIEDIQLILERCSQETFTPPASLNWAIRNTKKTLLEVDCLIAYDLTITDSERAHTRIDKSRWLHMETGIQDLKNQMRVDRMDLSIGLNLLTSSFGIETFSQNRQLIVFGREVDSKFRSMIMNLTQQPTYNSEQTEFPSSSGLNSSICPSNIEELSPENVSLVPNSALVSRSVVAQEPAPLMLKMVSKTCCSLSCTCKCHKSSVASTPRFLNHALGTLFLGYRAAPWFGQGCSNPLCRAGNSQFSYIYTFPAWFLGRVLQASLTFNHIQGPELVLRVMRVRECNDAPFRFINTRIDSSSTFRHVKAAIENAEASVLDILSNGTTILQSAIRTGVYDLVDYLLRRGADPYFESENGMMAYMEAWQLILNKPNSWQADRLFKLFDQSHLILFEFSKLHRAYLGLSGDDFATVLKSIDRAEIDVKDANSRTTLSWAAARSDQDGLRDLLACGADPNVVDNRGSAPLHWAAQGSEDATCVRQLIMAKACVNVQDKAGFTSLFVAVKGERVEKIKVLIENGADVNLRSRLGMSALEDAICNNCHLGIAVLLETGESKLSPSTPPGYSLLECIGLCADEATLKILRRHVQYLILDPARLEDHMDKAFDFGYLRTHYEDIKDPYDLMYRFNIALKDPVGWYKLFTKLAFEIYTLSGGKKKLNEKLLDAEESWDWRRAACGGDDMLDDADLTDDRTNISSEEEEEEEDDKIDERGDNDDNNVGSGSDDEEWHNAQEELEPEPESTSLPLSTLAL